jgi:hypothetical protein
LRAWLSQYPEAMTDEKKDFSRRDWISALGATVGVLALTNGCAQPLGEEQAGALQTALSGTDDCVDSIDALRRSTLHLTQRAVLVLGYHAPGDLGGGLFYWDPASVADDDGGTVLMHSASTGPGRWRRLFGPGARRLDVRAFGANLDGVTDDQPAIARANAALRDQSGDGVSIPAGTARLARTIEINRSCILSGGGGAAHYAATVLRADKGVTAIRVHSAYSDPNGPGAFDATIRDLTILSAGQIASEITPAIVVHSRCKISDVTVGDGDSGHFTGAAVHISAGSNRVPYTNANSWAVESLMSLFNGQALLVDGIDANAGCAIRVVSVGSRTWSIDDQSALGNTYVACHVDGGHGYRTSLAPSNASTFVGCYVEGGTICELGPSTNTFGGQMSSYDSGGTSTITTVTNRFQVGETTGASKFSKYQRMMRPKEHLELYCSDTTPVTPGGGRSYYEVRKTTTGDGATGWYIQSYTGQAFAFPWAWSDGDADVGGGHIWFPRGYFLGAAGNGTIPADGRIRVTVGAVLEVYGKPPTDGKLGDIHIAKYPRPGDPAEYRCVQAATASTPAVWAVSARVETA